MKTQIVIPSSGVIELYDDVPLSLNYNIANIRSPEKRNADYSKTIIVPGTDTNNELLAHIFEIATDRLFNPNKKINAQIVVAKIPVMKGILRLTRINALRNNKIEYELELKGRLDDLFMSIKDKLLTDISWVHLDHVWNKTSIQNSWSATVGTGYVYPWIDYGFGLPPNTMEVKCFRPATYVKEIWDRIFSFAGFQYSSTFLNTEFFKRLIIPFTSEKFSQKESVIRNAIFRAHLSNNQTFNYTGIGWANAVTDPIRFDNDFTPPSSDAGNNYNAVGTYKFTAPNDGVYSFTVQATLHFEIDVSASIQAFVRLMKNTIIELAYSNIINIPYTVATYPSGANETRTVSWTGFLFAGETIQPTIYSSISALPSTQNNFIAKNAFFYNSLNPEIVTNTSIPYSTAIPQNIKMEDFLLAIIKMFNLYFEYDKDVSNKIYIEPRNDYYNTTIQDWSKKFDTSKSLLIEPIGVLDVKRYIFKYRRDKDWLNEKYQASYQQVKEESYGIKVKIVDNDFPKNDTVLESMFSPTPQYSDISSDRVFPKVIKTDPNIQTPSTINANLRILYYGGELDCQQWTFYDITPNNAKFHTKYPYCGHIDHPSSPIYDLCFGVPKEIYYTPAWAATYTNNNLYNRFWRQFIEEIADKDSSIVTGWFRLTPADIAVIDFRHLYRFEFQNYRLNKIYDYDPVKEGLTKCEFIKTKTIQPFTNSTVLLVGGRDSTFDGVEAGPSIPPILATGGNKIPKETTERTIIGNDNYVSESATGVVITGDKNIVGEMAQNIAVLQSSGVIVAGGLKNVTVLQSSGITVLESNAVYQFNTKQTKRSAVKVYDAWLSQTGTNDPTAVVQENTLSGTLVWTRNSTGLYIGTLLNEFGTNRVVTTIEHLPGLGDTITAYPRPGNEIRVSTGVGATLTDGLLTSTHIRIEVYTNS